MDSFDLTYEEFFNLTDVEPHFSILTDYKPKGSLKWVQQNWKITYILSVIYLVIIFSIKFLMKNLKPFKLNLFLTLWNFTLTIFSAVGTYFTLPYLINTIYKKGFYISTCIATRNETVQYFIWLFALSKVLEFGDTLFIVLRKRPLIPLHYIHHCFTLIFTWYAYGNNISLGPWFVVMNYSVHTLMYFYYTLRSQNININKFISMCLTSLQIIQMIIGMIVCINVLYNKLIKQNHCECNSPVALAGLILYTVFLYMFSVFFYNSYLKNLGFFSRLGKQSKFKTTDQTNSLGSSDKWLVDDNNNSNFINNGLNRRNKSRKSITNYTRIINSLN